MGAIIRPFLIGAEISQRGFYLDDENGAVARQRNDIGAPPTGQRQFHQGREAQIAQEPPGAPRDRQSHVGLAAIDDGRRGIERRHGSGR